ncbi:TraK domain-containing protein [Burkholderia anthina]|uniref:TraK domain-containing protein n=1 Tax=Burkholderia anthina TaxID=179879 RepID=UPI00158A95AB|nr:type-F conjugative transfer system secretin TraK [Burkholderia anthina]
MFNPIQTLAAGVRLSAIATLAAFAFTASAQSPVVPADAKVGGVVTTPVPPIAIGASAAAAHTPAVAPTGNGATVPPVRTIQTTGALGGSPLPEKLPTGAGRSTGAVGAPAVPASAPSAQPAAGAVADGGAPAAVPTKSRMRRLSKVSPSTVDTSAALSARPIPPTPLDAPLPALGFAPGSDRPVKPTVVRCRPGVNAMVPVASGFMNQFDTPFSDPKVIDIEGDDENFRVGNSRYILPNKSTPIAIWITDSKPNAPKCSLTLIPQNIPAQNIILQLEGPSGATASGAGPDSEETGREGQYSVQLRTLMRSLARHIIPRGYSVERLDVPMAISNGIQAKPVSLYGGSRYDIYEYRLTNRGPTPVTLSEEAFATKGVRAVSFFPLLLLAPGQSTSVFIIADRPDDDAGNGDGGDQ